jgi:Beta-xylosidase
MQYATPNKLWGTHVQNMKTITGIFFVVMILASDTLAIDAQEQASLQSPNPNIWADVPDMAILRVEDTYYMSSTTMHMSPGLPIMQSKNLVDWEMVSYAYDILEDSDALALRNGKNTYGAGSWASSLRYHDGTFYVSTFANTTGKTHIYTTKNIANEPWKEITFSPALHDHSLFFDDNGKVYMLYGVGNLRLVEMKADLSGPEPGGFDDIVIRDAGRVAGGVIGLSAEGSQMFKREGKYYVCNITWPRNDMRTQIIHRADKITGPYEGRIILKDRGIAQGTLIDSPDGKWYAYLFQDCGAVGRIPFLIPVTWQDDWPVLGVDGKVPEIVPIAKTLSPMANIVESDEFDRSSELLAKLKTLPKEENNYQREAFPLAWQWNHNADNRYWSLTDRPGWLRLTSGRTDKTLPDARNMITQRTFGPRCSAVTLLDVSGLKDGDFAGLTSFQRKYGFVGVKMQNGEKSMVMVEADNDMPVEKASISMEGNLVYLKIECNFKDRKDEADFYWSSDGKEWSQIGTTLKMIYTLPHFMGYRFGLFHFATENIGGCADFDCYRCFFEVAGE